jgi:hypothetical protein
LMGVVEDPVRWSLFTSPNKPDFLFIVVDRGECSNFLQVRVIVVYIPSDISDIERMAGFQDVAKLVKEVYLAQSSSANFSMLSLGPPAK